MKNMKKVVALMLALLMTLTCIPCNVAHAADYDFTTAFEGTNELKCSGLIEKEKGSIKLDITSQKKDDTDKFAGGTEVYGLGNINASTLDGELASFKINYEDGISDQKIKVDVTLSLNEEYDDLFEALDAGTHILFAHYHHYYFDDEFANAITDIDKDKREIKFTLYDYANEEVYINVVELDRIIEGYVNFTEITDVNDFEDGNAYMLFEGKYGTDDLVVGLPKNGAELKIYKINNDTDFAAVDAALGGHYNTSDLAFDSNTLKNWIGYYADCYDSALEYLTQFEDIKTKGTASQYYNEWYEWYEDYPEGYDSFDDYLDGYNIEYNYSLDFYKAWKAISIARINRTLTSFTGIANVIGSSLSDDVVQKLILRLLEMSAPIEKVQAMVKVLNAGSKFDTCTEGAIGYENDHWWYACAYGEAYKDQSGTFYCYTCDKINKPYTATAKYVGKHTLNDDEYFEINTDDIEVTLTIDGKSRKTTDFRMADCLVGKWDNTVSIIIGDGDIINLEVTNYIPSSGGSSKKYKATDNKDTTEKITGTGKKGATRTIVPEEGRNVTDVIVKDKDGNEVEVTMNEDGTYSFIQPASNVTVEVLYEALTPEEEMQAKLMKDDVKIADSNEGEKINPNAKFIKGYDDGTFKPNKEVSNLELMCMVTQLFEDTAQLNAKEEIDLNQGDNEWAGNVAALANGLGLIPGNKNDENYDLNADVTRGDLAVVIYNLIKDYTPCDKLVDSDNCKDAVGKDYEEAVAKLVSLGILKGYDDGLFHGDNTLTRAEAVVVINRALISLGFEIKIDSLKVSFPDLSQSHWAYDEIMFAANK